MTQMTERLWDINIHNKPIILPALLVLLWGTSVLANREVMGIRGRRKTALKYKSNKEVMHSLLGRRASAEQLHAECSLYIILYC